MLGGSLALTMVDVPQSSDVIPSERSFTTVVAELQIKNKLISYVFTTHKIKK